jgi:ribonucleoside-triphosphate reductase
LEDFETCCLADINLPAIASLGEFLDISQLVYRLNKHSLMLSSHQKETEEVVHRNLRMGIGLTGICQASDLQMSWLNEAYEFLRTTDEEYSAVRGWPTSIKLTTVKPSGTLSLLPGVTPGIHPGFAQFMLRRIRIAAEHPLVTTCTDHGYPVEFAKNFDGSLNYGTCVVSCTVYYKPEELPAIRSYLEKNYTNGIKTVSFMLHSDHGFLQAPYEEISEEAYNKLVASTRVINSVPTCVEEELAAEDCEKGACPIR